MQLVIRISFSIKPPDKQEPDSWQSLITTFFIKKIQTEARHGLAWFCGTRSPSTQAFFIKKHV